jgi:hypothetical protein
MGDEHVTEAENLEEARARFWANYIAFGLSDEAWFNTHVKPLLKVAVPSSAQRRPAPPKLDRSEHLPWGPERLIDYYATYEPERAALTA